MLPPLLLLHSFPSKRGNERVKFVATALNARGGLSTHGNTNRRLAPLRAD